MYSGLFSFRVFRAFSGLTHSMFITTKGTEKLIQASITTENKESTEKLCPCFPFFLILSASDLFNQ